MSEEKAIKLPSKNIKLSNYSNINLEKILFSNLIFEGKAFYSQENSPSDLDEAVSSDSEYGPDYWIAPLISKTKDINGKKILNTYFDVEGPILTSVNGIEVHNNGTESLAKIKVDHDLKDSEIRKFCGRTIPVSEFAKLFGENYELKSKKRNSAKNHKKDPKLKKDVEDSFLENNKSN